MPHYVLGALEHFIFAERQGQLHQHLLVRRRQVIERHSITVDDGLQHVINALDTFVFLRKLEDTQISWTCTTDGNLGRRRKRKVKNRMYLKLFKEFGERIILLRDSHETLAARNGHFGEDVAIGALIPWTIQRIRQNFS